MQDLLELAFDDPAAAARLATGVLSSSEDPFEHSYAY